MTALNNLIDNSKFIPIYLERKDCPRYALPPLAVEIHPTASCNYNCIHCSYGSRNKKMLSLRPDTMKNLVNSLIKMKVKSVYFSGGGEPATFINWHKYAETLLDNDVDVSLITNGSLLNDETLPVVRRMNYIAVSVYSFYEDIYKKITGGNSFDIYWNLVQRIRTKPARCIIGARCVINSMNYNHIFGIYEKVKNAGYDYIIFIPEIDYERRGISLTKEHIGTLSNDILTHHTKIDVSFTNLLRITEDGFFYYGFEKQEHNSDCRAVTLRTNAFINYDGGVWLCQPHIGQKKYCIGNINDDDIASIWNGPRHTDVISRLNAGFKAGNCENCRSIGFNNAVQRYENTANNVSIRIIKDNFI